MGLTGVAFGAVGIRHAFDTDAATIHARTSPGGETGDESLELHRVSMHWKGVSLCGPVVATPLDLLTSLVTRA